MTSPVELGGVRLPLFHTVAVDRGPTIDLRITGVVESGSYVVTPATECDRLHVGDRLRGCYTNSAGHPGHARLRVRPIASGRTFTMSSVAGTWPSDAPPSGTWELDTAGMRPGAYTLSLQLVDPSPVGEARCYGSVSIAFTLAPRPALPGTPRSDRSRNEPRGGWGSH